jgi:hypothetical protein
MLEIPGRGGDVFRPSCELQLTQIWLKSNHQDSQNW